MAGDRRVGSWPLCFGLPGLEWAIQVRSVVFKTSGVGRCLSGKSPSRYGQGYLVPLSRRSFCHKFAVLLFASQVARFDHMLHDSVSFTASLHDSLG